MGGHGVTGEGEPMEETKAAAATSTSSKGGSKVPEVSIADMEAVLKADLVCRRRKVELSLVACRNLSVTDGATVLVEPFLQVGGWVWERGKCEGRRGGDGRTEGAPWLAMCEKKKEKKEERWTAYTQLFVFAGG